MQRETLHESPHAAPGGSEILLHDLISDVIRLPDCERNDRQRRVCRRAGGELASIGDKEVFDVVGLAPFIADPIFATSALAAGAQIVSGRTWRNPDDPGRTDGVIDHCASRKTVIPHGNVVRMIVKMDVWNRHPELIPFRRVERHSVRLLRHVFAHKPHARGISVGFHRVREVATPAPNVCARGEAGRKE